MAKWEKRLRAMIEDPRGHSYDEAASVLDGLDFTPPPKPKGSHRVWRHPSGARVGLVDKGHGTVPVEYIKTMLDTCRERGLIPNDSERNDT